MKSNAYELAAFLATLKNISSDSILLNSSAAQRKACAASICGPALEISALRNPFMHDDKYAHLLSQLTKGYNPVLPQCSNHDLEQSEADEVVVGQETVGIAPLQADHCPAQTLEFDH